MNTIMDAVDMAVPAKQMTYESVSINTTNQEFLNNFRELAMRSWEARGFEVESENQGRGKNYYGGTAPLLSYQASATKEVKDTKVD